jgi:DNA-binding YbaB/EbfC family protein
MNINKLMKQVQAIQEQARQAEEELSELRIEGTAGGGVVTATIDGKKNLIDLKIAPEALDPPDAEMLQDLILSAVSEAGRRAEDEAQERMGGLTGGLGGMIPGLG